MAGRVPGLVNASAALAVVLLVFVLAIRAGQTATPAIAEFAPQAQHPIQNAPSEQTGRFGSGAGGAEGAGAPSPSPAAGGVSIPAGAQLLHCVGDPPRQIEDPQSPPCVPFWAGSNGGSTSRGVSPTVIQLVDPNGGQSYHMAEKPRILAALQRFINTRFELYGRHIVLDSTGSCFSANQDSTAGQQANAVCVGQQSGAFASTDFYPDSGVAYYPELARQHVIGVSTTPQYDSQLLERYRPYLYMYPPSTDEIFATVGRWVCSELAGRNAIYGGDPTITSHPRVFGVVFQHILDYDDVTLDPLLQALAVCNVQPAKVFNWCSNCDQASDQENAINAVNQLHVAGVTTVLCLCNTLDIGNLPRAATAQGWHPEWAISSYLGTDTMLDIDTVTGSRDQLAHMFGLRFYPKAVGWADNPAAWAVTDEDPGYPAMQPPTLGYLTEIYRSLLLLASGFQMAGPRLTPLTFEAGLQKTVFPNPDTAIYAGHVGFQGLIGQDHSMMEDAAEIWWSNTDDGGAYCYVGHGARHPITEAWHQIGQLFEGPCDYGGASE